MHFHNSTTHRPAAPSKHALTESAKTILLVVLVVVATRSTAQSLHVDGHSMEQSLHMNQYVLINKIAFLHFDANVLARWLPDNHTLPPHVVYPFGAPQRGDIVVFDTPGQRMKSNENTLSELLACQAKRFKSKMVLYTSTACNCMNRILLRRQTVRVRMPTILDYANHTSFLLE
jgi:signal peptidase I